MELGERLGMNCFSTLLLAARHRIIWDDVLIEHIGRYPPPIPGAAHGRDSAHPFPAMHANGRRDVFSDF
jgi:hypothetical protein